MGAPQTEVEPGDDVVLLDGAGRPSGSAARATVHGPRTPLHLAFSCHLFDDRGQVLLTRRSLAKVAWPGVWTNSFCGHPRPGEPPSRAVRRYGRHELGIEVQGVTELLPDFRYRAVDAGGVVEDEVCPVFCARTETQPNPHPDEVLEHRWVDPAVVDHLVVVAPWLLSPWLVEQVRALAVRGGLHRVGRTG